MGLEPILKVPQTFVLTINTTITDVLTRLELIQEEPKSSMLPLHHKTLKCRMTVTICLLWFGRPVCIHQHLFCIVDTVGIEPKYLWT